MTQLNAIKVVKYKVKISKGSSYS